MSYEDAFLSTVQTTVQDAFRELLSNKHLYQTVRPSTEKIDEKAKQLHDKELRESAKPSVGSLSSAPKGGAPPFERVQGVATKLLGLGWQPKVPDPRFGRGIFPGDQPNKILEIEFDLPTIRTTCTVCKTDEPFNPIHCSIPSTKGSYHNTPYNEQDFVLQYQCQACKGQPVTFLLHRSKEKLRLSGREPMEIVTVPADIPKTHQDHYSSAIIAYQSGQVLPAIFMLRVFIEQYWLSFPTVRAAANATRFSGDIMGEEYKKLLPGDFKSRFPTLLETYGSLSGAIHTANADEPIFSAAKSNVLKHFEAIRAFDLDLIMPPPPKEDDASS